MPLFDDSVMESITDSIKTMSVDASAKKDSNKTKTGEYFKKYEESFINEIMERVQTNMDSIKHNLKRQLAAKEPEILMYLFSYNMTNFGDKQTGTNNGKKIFKGEETYRDAAIRLNYHKLCQPIPCAKESDEEHDEKKESATVASEEESERPAPFHYVFEFTDARYKLAQLIGKNFTIVKKYRRTDNSEEDFGKPPHIKTFMVSLFLKYHPKGFGTTISSLKMKIDSLKKMGNSEYQIKFIEEEIEQIVKQKKWVITEEAKPEEAKPEEAKPEEEAAGGAGKE